jgi:hypothetical protein
MTASSNAHINARADVNNRRRRRECDGCEGCSMVGGGWWNPTRRWRCQGRPSVRRSQQLRALVRSFPPPHAQCQSLRSLSLALLRCSALLCQAGWLRQTSVSEPRSAHLPSVPAMDRTAAHTGIGVPDACTHPAPSLPFPSFLPFLLTHQCTCLKRSKNNNTAQAEHHTENTLSHDINKFRTVILFISFISSSPKELDAAVRGAFRRQLLCMRSLLHRGFTLLRRTPTAHVPRRFVASRAHTAPMSAAPAAGAAAAASAQTPRLDLGQEPRASNDTEDGRTTREMD